VVEPTPPPPEIKHHEPKPEREIEKAEKITKFEPPKITKPDPESLEPKTEEKSRLPQVSTELVTRTSDSRKEAKARAEEKAREQAREEAREQARQAEARARLAERFDQAAEKITGGVSSGTAIKVPRGPGGGGVPYANFRQAVQSVYERAWIVPNGVTDNEATALVSVTIARDGRVVSAHIERSSGNREVDRSVQNALDRVKYAAPLPEESKENERTVPINFNVRAKRGLG
jgi:TolA protein